MIIPNPYFKNIPVIGDLEMDYIIYEYDYPLLFICKTPNDIFYLCDCCDTYKEQRWLIVPITVESIHELLTNKITMRETFENAKGLCCVATWSTGDLYEKYKLLKAEEFDADDLPEAGEYIDAEIDEHEEYIKRIKNRLLYRKEYNSEQNVMFQSETSKDSVEFNDLMYQYQKEVKRREITIPENIRGTVDGNITNEDSKRRYSGIIDNRQSTEDVYYVFAA